ncbi:MAG: cytochrome ubiquinol oxidase subunit I [bacterium]
MDPIILSRIQFAITVGYHYIFPPMSIGLGILLVIMEGIFLKTKNPLYEKLTKFWVKIFALIFGFGVASGFVMELQFGTNWSQYSRFVGDVFGSPLAAEGLFAFFLESAFLAVLVFGWKKVSPRMHFFSTIMVALGAHLSALWIIVANSWQQTPSGYHIVTNGNFARAEITDFWAMVFNPSTVERLTHTLSAAWITGACLVAAVSAYHLLKKINVESAKRALKISVVVLFIASLFQLYTGHTSANGVARYQPTKLAALEGHYKTGPADMYLIGWVNEKEEITYGIKLPGMLSWLVSWDSKTVIKGLKDYPKGDRPPVNIVFQTYHVMVLFGMFFIFISALSLFLFRGGKIFNMKWLLIPYVFSILFAQLSNQLGWMSAEIGRQPWIVYGLLRTKDAISVTVSGGEVLFSVILFSCIYLLLFTIFIWLMFKQIKKEII